MEKSSENKLLWKQWLDPLEFIENIKKQSISQKEYLNSKVLVQKTPILKLPLQFTFQPVQIISKQLTKLNSTYKQRIIYLGPRWSDSVLWHKKYSSSNIFKRDNKEKINENNGTGDTELQCQSFPNQIKSSSSSSESFNYPFNFQRVSRNNSYIYDSMQSNRHFKNQVYYRAFEGMNPTLNTEEDHLFFQSRFESGNLDCVVKVDENEYDLFLRIDSNTRGNIFWYYFDISFGEIGKCKSPSTKTRSETHPVYKKKVKLNICNITKSKTLYEQNLKPYIKREKLYDELNSKKSLNMSSSLSSNLKKSHQPSEWIQGDGVSFCQFRQKKLRYQFIYEKVARSQRLYELSFELQIKSNEIISLAYCIPYTYSELLGDLIKIQQKVVEKRLGHVSIGKLGETLTGVDIPALIIGNLQENKEEESDKKVVFITGRVHPGQTNGSLVLSSLINQLCTKKNEDSNFIFKKLLFVIIPMLNPDGVILGNGRCSALGRDLNREFKSWNKFINPEVVAIKKLVDKIQQNYEIQMYLDFHGHSKKKNVFLFGPPYNITEVNYYRCRVFPKILSKHLDYFRYFSCNYTIPQYKRTTARAVMLTEFNVPFFYTIETSIGFYHDYIKRIDKPFTVEALNQMGKKFILGMKQYFEGILQYEDFVKSHKKDKLLLKNISPELPSSPTKLNPIQKDSQKSGFPSKSSTMKLIKVFQQIKIEEKRLQQSKKGEKPISQASSDSCNQEDELQSEKLKEFTDMIVNCSKLEQAKHAQSCSLTEPFYPKNSQILVKRAKKKKFTKDDDKYTLLRNLVSRTENRASSSGYRKNFRSKILEHQKTQVERFEEEIIIPQQRPTRKKYVHEKGLETHNFYKKYTFSLQTPQPQKVNYLNFSKVLQNPKSVRYLESRQSDRSKSPTSNRKSLSTAFRDFENKKFMSIEPFNTMIQNGDTQSPQKYNKQSSMIIPSSKPYPSSFYRIKYHQASHKRNHSNLRNQMQFQEDDPLYIKPEQKIIVPSPQKVEIKRTSKFNKRFLNNIEEGEKKIEGSNNNKTVSPQKLFINISKIQNI